MVRSQFAQSHPSSINKLPVPSKPAGQHDVPPVFRASKSSNSLQNGSAAQVKPFSPSKIQIKHAPRTSVSIKLSRASEVFATRKPSQAASTFGGMYACAGCGEMSSMAETTRELNHSDTSYVM